MTKFERTIN